jgi:uncharacterized membrane protein YdbT with pleckstrin-like domain
MGDNELQTAEPTADLERNVHADETLQWVTGPHTAARFLSQVGSGAIGSLIFGGVLGAAAGYGILDITERMDLAVGVGLAVLAVVVVLTFRSALTTLLFDTTEYAATDQRLITYGGTFGRGMSSIPFEGVQDAQYQVSAVERFFDVGTVTVDTGRGYETMTFRFVPSPSAFAREVTEIAGQARQRADEEAEAATEEPSYTPGEGIDSEEPTEALTQNVYADEEVQWVVRPKRSARLLDRLSGAVGSAVFLALFFGFIAFMGTMVLTDDVRLAAYAVGGVAVLAFLLVPGFVLLAYRYATIEYAATDRRLLTYRDYLGRRLDSLPLEGIQDAEYSIGFRERLFDVGTVGLDTDRGYETMTFTHVPNPTDFAREVSQLAGSDIADRAVGDLDESAKADDIRTSEPSADLEKNVHGDETIQWVVRPHKTARLLRVVAGRFVAATIASVVLGAFAGGAVLATVGGRDTAALAALGAFLLIFLVMIVKPLARYVFGRTEYALTDDRVVAYSGVFGRELSGIPLKGVQDAEYSVDAVGDRFEMGDVTLDTDRGYGTLTLSAIPKPAAVAREITRVAKAVGDGQGGGEDEDAETSTDTDQADASDGSDAAPAEERST